MEERSDAGPHWGTSAEADLLGADTVVVQELDRPRNGDFNLTAQDHRLLARVILETARAGQFFDGKVTPSYRINGLRSRLIGFLVRSPTLGGNRFMFIDAAGNPLGVFEDEWVEGLGDTLRITPLDGIPFRLTTPDPVRTRIVPKVSEWDVWNGTTSAGSISSVRSRQLHRFTVRLGPGVVGVHRLLIWLSPIILDYRLHPHRR